jgi:rubredoxin
MDDRCECPHCGHAGDLDEFADGDDSAGGEDWLVCPDCGAGGMADDFAG